MATRESIRARVAHNVPGRIRLRVERASEVSEAARRIEQALSSMPGIMLVEPRPSARSVVIVYNRTEVELQHLLEEGLPAAAVEIFDSGIRQVANAASGTRVGRNVVKTVSAVNAGVERATGGTLDLRDVFPLTLLGLGVRRVLQGNLQPVPWYNLLYYGYSTFVALHSRRQGPAPSEPDAEEILRRRYAQGELTREQYQEMVAELQAISGAALPPP